MSFHITIWQWVRSRYYLVVRSIAFVPAIIAVAFLLLSVVMLAIDFSDFGKTVKSTFSWVSLKDAATARSITATIAAGTISLLVFSFSMVMILLNQAASAMSNRILASLISNRFQQIVLGVYVGSIVYALFLLSTIRDVVSGIYVPALSIYMLILLTVIDVFLFIYFLHYVTQSVKYEVIIERIHKETRSALEKHCRETCKQGNVTPPRGIDVPSPVSGYYQGFQKEDLVRFCTKHDLVVYVLPTTGAYLLKGRPFLRIVVPGAMDADLISQCLLFFDFFNGQPIDTNPSNGFHQLKEIAIKALSPGINDPGTALLCVHALVDLFAFRICSHPATAFPDSDGQKRVFTTEIPLQQLFNDCFLPFWDYAKNDRTLMKGMKEALLQLKTGTDDGDMFEALQAMLSTISRSISDLETTPGR